MATLNGKKLTEKQYAALKIKWANDDKKFFKERYQSDIKRLQDQLKIWKAKVAKSKKSRGITLGIELNAIKNREAEIKALKLKIKNL